MMTEQDHHFMIAMEECDELSQRISKAARFGLEQVQEDPDDKPEENPHRLNNRERIREEFIHVFAMLDLIDPRILSGLVVSFDVQMGMLRKREKVQKYFERSRREGRLE